MKTKYLLFNLLLFTICNLAICDETSDPKIEKIKTKSKVFARSIFNVVQFPNVGCAGSNGRNGTCYTSSECTTKSGTSSGTCANGYGVCCIIQLACSQTSSENCTYLVQAATTNPSQSSCTYTICPTNSNVCRIRLDFTTFDISGPFTNPVSTTANTATTGGGVGDCVNDAFSVNSPGNRGSPDICGFNTGQHIFVDASSDCSTVSFRFGTAAFTRSYDIKVTQYNCNDELAGPPDCLQYFTGNTGTVKSFNYRTNNNLVTSSVTHLANQFYDMCFRRNAGKCAICFVPTITIAPAGGQNSFGLSISGIAAMTTNLIDSSCTGDYLIIPNGVNTAATALGGGFTDGADRICGRIFSATFPITIASESICTGRRPFRITFRTDADEMVNVAPAIVSTATDETNMAPGGIIGFSLDYVQQACP